MGFVGHDSAGQRLRGIIKNGLLCSVMVGALGMSGLSLAADNQEFMQGLFNYQHKMAELGNAEAQFKLAEMYEQGQGVAADPKQARHWYEAAAAQGFQPALDHLERMKKNAATATPAAPAAPVAPVVQQPVATPPKAPAKAATDDQESERLRQERAKLEQELAKSREELRRMQEQQAQQARQRDEELRKAEAEKQEALRKLAAQQRLEEERKKMLETPAGYDN